MKRFLLGVLVVTLGVGVFSLTHSAVLYDRTVRIVDNLGNVLGGSASATVAPYDMTVRVVDQNGAVQSSLGSTTQPMFLNQQGTAGGGGTTAAANQTTIMGFILPYPVTATELGFAVTTADNANASDVGIYGPCSPGKSCALAADTGSFTSASTGYRNLNFITAATCTGSGTPSICCTGSGTGPTCPVAGQTFKPGLYFEGLTSAGSTITLTFSNNANFNFYGRYTSQGVSANGILPATITTPSTVSATTALGVEIALTP